MPVPAFSIAASLSLQPIGLLGGVSSGEIVVVLVVVLIIFGPKQLPDLARTIGKALQGVRKAADDLKQEIGLDELSRPFTPRRGPPPRQIPPPAPEPVARDPVEEKGGESDE